jgi:two-component system sensor histidine kinase TctE
MLPLLSIVGATAVVGIYNTQRITNLVFDRWLLDNARALASLVRFEGGQAVLELPEKAEALLLYDDVDRTWFGVTEGRRHVAGRDDLPTQGDGGYTYNHGAAYFATVDGEPVRTVRVDLDEGRQHVRVLVAETLRKRRRAEQQLLALLWPVAVLLLATPLAIVIAVRSTVQPLQAMAARWNERSHASLATIDTQGVPRELLPFANALNDLLQRMRAMLEREQRFSATAAHQLRTPLTGLQLGLARAREAGSVPAMRAVLDELSHSTQRTARMVQQLLVLGRLDPEGGPGLPTDTVDLVGLAQEVGAAHADLALAKGIDLELEAPPQPLLQAVQPDLIAEALGNLLDNAIRYTPPGGRVVVQLGAAPITLAVADSGPGIAEDERQRVFERFVRGRRADGDGSGLGLAIVRDIAQLHGASVTLGDSEWGGTRVALVFAAGSPPPVAPIPP